MSEEECEVNVGVRISSNLSILVLFYSLTLKYSITRTFYSNCEGPCIRAFAISGIQSGPKELPREGSEVRGFRV